MRDKGLDRGLVQQFDTSDKRGKGHFYGFRKMFWEYLNKLGVGFYDPCCPEASLRLPVYIDRTTNILTYINTSGVSTTYVASAPSYRAITAPTTITATDSTIDATAGTFTQPLPASATGNKGKVYYIKNSGAGVITVNVTGGQLIDGAATRIINPTESIPFQSTGTGYIIL